MPLDDNVVQFSTPTDARLRTICERYTTAAAAGLVEELKNLVLEQNDEAMVLLAGIYEFGADGVEKNVEAAESLYSEAAHLTENVEAYFGLARIALFGKLGASDPVFARKCYEIVDGASGSAVGDLMLGRMWHHGLGGDRDLSRARQYYEQAIAKGSVFARTERAQLDQLEGRYLRSLWARLSTAVAAACLTLRNPADPRLRRF